VKRRGIVLASAALAIAMACSSPDEGATVNGDVGVSDERFEVVSDMLVYQCGTLDCHGNTFRNLRFYGYGGLRFDSDMKSDDSPTSRFRAEVRRNYESIAGLEPEMFARVVNEGGREPERLDLVAKARAVRNHKGGPVMIAGDDIDVCITSWLAKNVDVARCQKVAPFSIGMKTAP
jgi:hypothetical protein